MSDTQTCFYCTDEYKGYMKEICKLEVSTVYLNNEQEYLGRCTVVLNDHKTELFQLEEELRGKYMRDVARVAAALKQEFAADKMNYAVYGDIDSHLHFHVVPKHKHSKNWGWPFELTAGEGNEKFLTNEEYQSIIERIVQHLR
ncbi:HIT family protein [Cohnella soli]|uniref:HIT family protein n=1 Tax=Cohnella soli TaxID=425005 RepID=A0ABW0HP15_9BACL